MPISRGQMPRQLYGLGSFVKSIGKGIKKVILVFTYAESIGLFNEAGSIPITDILKVKKENNWIDVKV